MNVHLLSMVFMFGMNFTACKSRALTLFFFYFSFFVDQMDIFGTNSTAQQRLYNTIKSSCAVELATYKDKSYYSHIVILTGKYRTG